MEPTQCLTNASFELSKEEMLSLIEAPNSPLPIRMQEAIKLTKDAEQPDGSHKYSILNAGILTPDPAKYPPENQRHALSLLSS